MASCFSRKKMKKITNHSQVPPEISRSHNGDVVILETFLSSFAYSHCFCKVSVFDRGSSDGNVLLN